MAEKNVVWPGWETIGIIGRGSFGAVYEIQRDVLGDIERAALKVISIPQNDGDIDEMYGDGYDEESITSTLKSHLKSIVAEYSLMRKMNSCANIVNCDDISYVQHDDGIGWDIFIKMELLTPLVKALPAKIPEETVVRVAKDMCAALELCKKHGIVHRDIKPQNIFLSPNGDYKLGDFGIAKTVERTMGGTKIGTYKYMAPEVYNNQPYGAAADIYSLGLVLYWMLNERRVPFLPLPPEKLNAGMDEQAKNRRMAGEQIPPPAHGSKELKRIVLKACAYDPAERYASATDMLRDLKRAFIDEDERREQEERERRLKEEAERERIRREQECLRKEQEERDRRQQEEAERERVRREQETQKCLGEENKNQGPHRIEKEVQERLRDLQEEKKTEQKEKRSPYRKWILGIAVAVVLIVLVIFYSWTGWIRFGGKQYYLIKGEKVVGWHTIAGSRYYFDNDGVKCTGFKAISGKKYYFGDSGAMVTGWKSIDNKRYYFDNKGVMKRGWQTISGRRYFFNFEGVMQTGWLDAGDGKYYLGTSGVMQTGFAVINQNKYYFAEDGKMHIGWLEIGDETYYCKKSGACAIGEIKIDGEYYTFDNQGVLVTGR